MSIDPKIKQKADDIRTKVYGSEVRESLASGLEAMSEDVVNNTDRQTDVEEQFQEVIENTTDKDVISAPEIIAARNGEANLKQRLDKENQQVTAQLAQTEQLLPKGVQRGPYWNADPSSGSNGAWSDRNVTIIGDSHGWGEGAPNYQGISSGYSLHSAWVHNKGFFGRLIDYLYGKWDSQPWRVVPLQNNSNLVPKSAQGAVAHEGTYTENSYKDYHTFTMAPRIVAGKYYISTDFVSENVNPNSRNMIYAHSDAEAREDSYAKAEYKHNTLIGRFGKNVLMLTNDDEGKSAVLFDMVKPSRYARIHLVGASEYYGKAIINLLNPLNRNSDGTENWEGSSNGFGDSIFGNKAPKVYVRESIASVTNYIEAPNATVFNNRIEIDCSNTSVNNQADYLIDFGQKKIGTLKLSYTVGQNTSQNNGILGAPVIGTRGVIFGNGDLVKNWSMGGHTTGALLGLESSYAEEVRNHVADIKSYLTGPTKGLVIQAPLVNEWLKQTPLTTFKERLTLLADAFNTDDIIILTTLGLRSQEDGSDTGAIKFQEYADAVGEWADENPGVTLVDCRKNLFGLVEKGVIAYDDLWINNGHPSPATNEHIYEMLKKAVDLRF